MEKYLIINADDYGMCRAANFATWELLEKGGITSATVMVPCGWSTEACKWAAQHPEYAIGVHLTFTSEWGNYKWSPIANGDTASLRDEFGFMFEDCAPFEESADLAQVELEIRAQIERARQLGLNPSHLDNHMGSLYGIERGHFELLQKTFEIAGEYKLPFRFPGNFLPQMLDNSMLGIEVDGALIQKMFASFVEMAKGCGVAVPDYLLPHDWSGSQKDSYENFREHIYELVKTYPDGITETYIHPALECDELKGTSSVWERRVWEHRLFGDPATRQHIEACGFQLINYRDLARMKA